MASVVSPMHECITTRVEFFLLQVKGSPVEVSLLSCTAAIFLNEPTLSVGSRLIPENDRLRSSPKILDDNFNLVYYTLTPPELAGVLLLMLEGQAPTGNYGSTLKCRTSRVALRQNSEGGPLGENVAGHVPLVSSISHHRY